MKTKIFLITLLFFFSTSLFCQEFLYDSIYTEKTAITGAEKEIFGHIMRVYSGLNNKGKDCEGDCYDYVVKVFPKIDSLQRLFYVSKTNDRMYIASKTELLVGKEEGGYYGDKVKIMLNPDASLEHCYIDMEISYPAAGVSEAQINFVVNKDIYETYRYFTNSGGGYVVFSFKVNGIEKYRGEREKPYEIFLY